MVPMYNSCLCARYMFSFIYRTKFVTYTGLKTTDKNYMALSFKTSSPNKLSKLRLSSEILTLSIFNRNDLNSST